MADDLGSLPLSNADPSQMMALGQQPPPPAPDQAPPQQAPQLPARPVGTSGAAQPVSKAEFFRNMLGQFFYSVGSGLANRGSGPDADLRGAGAALTALPQLHVQQQQIEIARQQAASEAALRQAQANKAQQESQSVPVTLGNGQQVFLPASIAKQILAAQTTGQSREAVQGLKNTGAESVQGLKNTGTANVATINQGMPVAVSKELQEQFGVPAELPLKQLNALESAANKPLTTVQGATDAYLVNKQTGAKTALGVGSGRIAARLAGPVQVADPDNAGGVKYMPASEAMRTGAQAASSAQVTAPKAVIKDFTSGQSAKTLNSFNTATEHLKLLSQLGDALENGAVPIVNRIANQYATATGGAAPTSFDMAKQAVAGEVAKTFKGQATEGEISAINSTLNNAQSPAQLKGAIGTALALMESKRAALMEQYDKGIKASPAFPGGKGALNSDEARAYLQKAGGDANKARALAKKDGRTF